MTFNCVTTTVNTYHCINICIQTMKLPWERWWWPHSGQKLCPFAISYHGALWRGFQSLFTRKTLTPCWPFFILAFERRVTERTLILLIIKTVLMAAQRRGALKGTTWDRNVLAKGLEEKQCHLCIPSALIIQLWWWPHEKMVWLSRG